MSRSLTSIGCILLASALLAGAQTQPPAPPPGFGPRIRPAEQQEQAPSRRPERQPQRTAQPETPPSQEQPATEGGPAAETGGAQAPTAETGDTSRQAGETVGPVQPQEGTAAPGTEAAKPVPPPPPLPQAAPTGALNLQNAALTQVIDALCRQLRINYILDPRVKGGVILNTYGETKNIDTRSLLDLVLQINGATMVKVGEVYRIVPLAEASRLPIPPTVNPEDIPEDDQIMLNLVFLKYVTVAELSELVEPFIGEGASTWAYPPANLLLLLDTRRNMRRTMELISLFDNDALANQRIRTFETEHGRPSVLVEELETVLQSISLSETESPIKFLPIDRLNLIVAVAPNPGAFEQVEEWLRKLDQPVKVTAGTVDNHVYRVRYRRAEHLAMAIMQLYGGYRGGGYGMMGGGLFSGAAAGFGNRYATGGMGGYGGYGGGMGGYGGGMGGYGGGYGGYGGGMGGYGGGFGMTGMSYSGQVSGGYSPMNASREQQMANAGSSTQIPASFASPDQTGSYMGSGGGYGGMGMMGIPRVIPNPLDNTLLIQSTPQEYKQIVNLLEQIDTPPRQVLIDAKIYEVTLTGAFAAGVSAYLQKIGNGDASVPTRLPLGSTGVSGLDLSVGMLVGQSRELLSFLKAEENTTRAKVISAPTVIATDSIPASINVGTEVPTLTGQAASGVQIGGNSQFTQSIQNRNSGTTLSILARVNDSGIVTLVVDQETSSPIPPAAGSIQSPSFSKRTVQTQVTLNDGDTIAIGGIINETDTISSGGIPYLHRIPILGYAFGGKSTTSERTELIIFMTPRVIYDMNQVIDATEELKSRFKKLNRQLRKGDL